MTHRAGGAGLERHGCDSVRFVGESRNHARLGQRRPPTVVTTPSPEERTHRFPFFLPDGHRFLYWSQADQGGTIMAASLEGGPSTRLVASMSKGEYSAGHLLYLDGTTLTAQPFDPARLQLGLPPSASLPNVLRSQGSGSAAFTASASGLLSYRTLTAEIFQMSRIDRLGRRGAAIGEPGPWVQMAASPNGRQLAVQRDRTAASDIWLFDLGRSVSSKFTVEGGNNGPVWSPDGSELIFRNNRRVLNEVFRKPLAGGSAAAWTGIPSERLEDWSRDGRYLVMGQASGAILAVPVTGGGQPIVAVPPGSADESDESQMSPDGRWISYNSSHVRQLPDLSAALSRSWRACDCLLARRRPGQVARGLQGALLPRRTTAQ